MTRIALATLRKKARRISSVPSAARSQQVDGAIPALGTPCPGGTIDNCKRCAVEDVSDFTAWTAALSRKRPKRRAKELVRRARIAQTVRTSQIGPEPFPPPMRRHSCRARPPPNSIAACETS